jgi:hypothetical protein
MRSCLVLLLFLCSCSTKHLRTAPIPTTPMSVEKEMSYIENTDQTDRHKTAFRLIVFPNGKTAKKVWHRDSVRVDRVRELIKSGQVTSDSAKFSAGIVLFHNGFPRRALKQFNDVNARTMDNAMKLNSQTWINECIKDTLRK